MDKIIIIIYYKMPKLRFELVYERVYPLNLHTSTLASRL